MSHSLTSNWHRKCTWQIGSHQAGEQTEHCLRKCGFEFRKWCILPRALTNVTFLVLDLTQYMEACCYLVKTHSTVSKHRWQIGSYQAGDQTEHCLRKCGFEFRKWCFLPRALTNVTFLVLDLTQYMEACCYLVKTHCKVSKRKKGRPLILPKV